VRKTDLFTLSTFSKYTCGGGKIEQRIGQSIVKRKGHAKKVGFNLKRYFEMISIKR
jgi:hypothetical protein